MRSTTGASEPPALSEAPSPPPRLQPASRAAITTTAANGVFISRTYGAAAAGTSRRATPFSCRRLWLATVRARSRTERESRHDGPTRDPRPRGRVRDHGGRRRRLGHRPAPLELRGRVGDRGHRGRAGGPEP